MKLLKGGAHLGGSGIIGMHDNGRFLVQCPDTGGVYVLQKMRSSNRECYYITPQFNAVEQDDMRHAIFQYYGDGNRRVHFSDSQIDWAIRSGNFVIERV